MAEYLLLLMASAMLLCASCKKGTDYGTIATQLGISGVGQKNNIRVDLYGVSSQSWFIDSLYTDADGVVDFGNKP